MKQVLSQLAITALLCGVAWAFWHYAGADAFDIFTLFALLILAVDNFRLRRALKKR